MRKRVDEALREMRPQFDRLDAKRMGRPSVPPERLLPPSLRDRPADDTASGICGERVRRRVEEVFGWMKTIGGLRKTRHRGVERVGFSFVFAEAVYTMVRMRTLLVQTA